MYRYRVLNPSPPPNSIRAVHLLFSESLLQEVLGEPCALLIRLCEAVVSAVVRIVDDLGSLCSAEFAEEHNLGFGVWGVLL